MDALEKDLNANNYDWVCELHRGLVIRICSIIPSRGDLHDRIAEKMDPVIFRQMLENQCFTGDDFLAMVNYVYDWLLQLCAPVRDDDIKRTRAGLVEAMTTLTFGRLVPMFLKGVHTHLDRIEKDVKRVKSSV